jgi:alpha-galactosidase
MNSLVSLYIQFITLANPDSIMSSSTTTFSNIYGVTSSSLYTLDITFASQSNSSAVDVTVSTSASEDAQTGTLDGSSNHLSLKVALAAGSDNTIAIKSIIPVKSISITAPEGSYYPSTAFEPAGEASATTCEVGFCQPVGSKIGNLSPSNSASLTIGSEDEISTSVDGVKYVEVDYINNEVSFSTSWEDGTNTRNLTISINGGEPTRLEVPLSGVSSELFSTTKGWQDSATYGVLTSGWVDGENEVVVGNQGGEADIQPLAADFVGIRVYN